VAQLRAEHAAETRELNAKIEGLAATLRDLSQDVVRLLGTRSDLTWSPPRKVEVDDAGARGDEAQRAQEAAREEVVAFMKQRGMPLQDEMVDSFMSSKPRLARRNVVGQKILVGDQ